MPANRRHVFDEDRDRGLRVAVFRRVQILPPPNSLPGDPVPRLIRSGRIGA
jgi:hypothetical protein